MAHSDGARAPIGLAELNHFAESLDLGPLRRDLDDDDFDGNVSVATSFGSATREIYDLDESSAGFFDQTRRDAPVIEPQSLDDDLDAGCHRLLQSMLSKLLLRQGVLEDHGPDANNTTLTLRDMRRTGALGDLNQDAQMTLLGGTLYAYSEQGILPRGSHRGSHETAYNASVVSLGHAPLQDAIGRSLDRILTNPQQARISDAGESTVSEPASARTIENAIDPVSSAVQTLTSFGSMLDHAESVSEVDSDREEEGVVSVVAVDTPRSMRSQYSITPDQTFLEETSVAGLGDTIQSSSSGSSSFEAQQRSLRTGLDTLSLEGLDGGLVALLNRLSFDISSLDESLSNSMRTVMQIGTVLTGQHLSDDEISALPKVRFDQTEQQNCAICLEPYQRGELLTSLSCHHFFHVDCLAGWFRRSAQCPLCRHIQGE